MDSSALTLTPSAEERRSGAFSAETLAAGARIFSDHGGLVLSGVFDRALVDRAAAHFHAAYREDYEDPLRRRVEKVGDKRNLKVVEIEGPFNDPAVWANPFLYGVAKSILGEQCVVGQFGSVTSLPGAAAQPIHRDSPWLFREPALDVTLPAFGVTVVVPLVDMRSGEAGTTRIVPGSHRVFSDEAADAREPFDPVLPRGSCLLMDSRVRHGGTANVSSAPRPILYMSYQRHWFRDYDGYNLKPPVHVSDEELEKMAPEHQRLFSWARADNTPETLRLAVRRLMKKASRERLRAVLKRFV